MIEGRYNRQELIKGWDQLKLDRARVVVVGTGVLAQETLAGLTALGIGNLEIYDNSKVDGSEKGFLLTGAVEGEPRVKSLENMLEKINSKTRIKGMNILLSENLISMIGKPDVIIDTSNDSKSKEEILKYGNSKGVNVISVSAERDKSEMYFVRAGEEELEAKLIGYKDKEQGKIVSGIMGGIITEEIRKLVMPLNERERVVDYLSYSLGDEKRFGSELILLNRKDLKEKKILIIGAGALGNFAVLGAALEGIGDIDVMDFDSVESTNLNRQILFYDAVGKDKATVLAERVRDIVPDIKIRGLVEKLDENSNYFSKEKPDLIFDCVDSFSVRGVINYFAVHEGIPLISGGTNPKSGQVVVYVPGESACLDCKLDVEQALAEQRRASSCRYSPDPSVIMTNQIIGNMMVGEGVKVLDEGYGIPVRRILKYDSTIPVRGGLVGSDEKCYCEKPDIKEWLENVDGKLRKEV